MLTSLDVAAEKVQACLDDGTWRLQLKVIADKADPDILKIAELVGKHEAEVVAMGPAAAFLYYTQGLAKLISCFPQELYRRDTATAASIYALTMAEKMKAQDNGQVEDGGA